MARYRGFCGSSAGRSTYSGVGSSALPTSSAMSFAPFCPRVHPSNPASNSIAVLRLDEMSFAFLMYRSFRALDSARARNSEGSKLRATRSPRTGRVACRSKLSACGRLDGLRGQTDRRNKNPGAKSATRRGSARAGASANRNTEPPTDAGVQRGRRSWHGSCTRTQRRTRKRPEFITKGEGNGRATATRSKQRARPSQSTTAGRRAAPSRRYFAEALAFQRRRERKQVSAARVGRISRPTRPALMRKVRWIRETV